MTDATRQHYKMATGHGLDDSPPKTSRPGFAKGGHVKGVSHSHSGKGHHMGVHHAHHGKHHARTK